MFLGLLFHHQGAHSCITQLLNVKLVLFKSYYKRSKMVRICWPKL